MDTDPIPTLHKPTIIVHPNISLKKFQFERVLFKWNISNPNGLFHLLKPQYTSSGAYKPIKSEAFETGNGEKYKNPSKWQIVVKCDYEEKGSRYVSFDLFLMKSNLPKVAAYYVVSIYKDGRLELKKESSLRTLTQGMAFGWKKFCFLKDFGKCLYRVKDGCAKKINHLEIHVELLQFKTKSTSFHQYLPLIPNKLEMIKPTYRHIVAHSVKNMGFRFGVMSLVNEKGEHFKLPKLLVATGVNKLRKMMRETNLDWLPEYEQYNESSIDMTNWPLDIVDNFIAFLFGIKSPIILKGAQEDPKCFFAKKVLLFQLAQEYEFTELALYVFSSMCSLQCLDIENSAQVAVFAKELTQIEDIHTLGFFNYEKSLNNLKNVFISNYDQIAKTKAFKDNYAEHWEFFLDLIIKE